MDLTTDAAGILEALLANLQEALGPSLVGLYLRGSLALGDFVPATSDLDVLGVTEAPVTPAEFATLADLHARLAARANPYARRLEIAYLDRASLGRYQPGQRHPTLGQGEALAWSEHGQNWVLERWTVREHGVTLLGPDPRVLIDPIAPEALRAAVRVRLQDWLDWADQPDDPDWQLPRSHKAYVVATMCRALYTLSHSALCTKAQAVSWALAAFPEPWRPTVERSQAWLNDHTLDPDLNPEVRRLVRWAASFSDIIELP